MKITELLARLKAAGIRLWVDGERLRYEAPAGALTPTLRSELGQHKAEVLQFLRTATEATASNQAVIPVAQHQGDLPLSFAQQRLWFLCQLNPQSSHYNIVRAFHLKGQLQKKALQLTLNEIVRRHEALRTVFTSREGKPSQQIMPAATVATNYEDLCHLPADQRQAFARQLAEEEYQTPFDLQLGPLMRTRLLSLGSKEHVLIVAIHHIVADGWSMGVLYRELGELYRAFCQGYPTPLPELPFQYSDFAIWQRKLLSGERFTGLRRYWQEQLANLTVLQLPTDRQRPPVQTYRGAAESLTLSSQLSDGIRHLGHHSSSTPFMVLLAAFASLLRQYCGQDDIVVGSPIANRSRAELEAHIGFFVNSLVMRINSSGNPTFRELLDRVRKTAMDAFQHQDLPFEALTEELESERDLSRNPIFQVTFAVQNAPLPDLSMGDLTLALLRTKVLTTRFDLEVHVWPEKDSFAIWFIYNTDLFDQHTISRMLGHYRLLLGEITLFPDSLVAELPLLNPAEEQQILTEWNSNSKPLPVDHCIHGLVEKTAARLPSAPAVVGEVSTLTYAELNSRANRLARFLVNQGAGPEVPVGVLLNRSTEMVVTLLAVLKSGAAFVPLDPDLPAERLAFMLSDIQAPVLVTRRQFAAKAVGYSGRLVNLDEQGPQIDKLADENLPARNILSNVAYFIFTSGSTGRPKAVAIPHQGLLNLVSWHVDAYGITPSDRATQVAGVGFDATVWELWPYLASGASIFLAPDAVLVSPARFWQWLVEKRITVCFLPTPLAEAMLAAEIPAPLQLRYLLIGGDLLHEGPDEELPFVLVNHYGPTENSVVTTCTPVSAGKKKSPPSIGRPITNVEAYVLNSNLQPVAVGVPGELYVGGQGLARGYANRAQLTAAHFIPHPFNETSGGYLYKTGDLVKFLPDGNLQFLGRTDDQLKIRGFRIEPGEIEARLCRHPLVREAAVISRPLKGAGQGLAAYIVPADSCESAARFAELHVDEWQALYNRVYEAPHGGDATFNIVGWHSSYTEEAIPADQMRHWLDATCDRIIALAPARVLEIGCGTGLLLFRLAPRCVQYLGTDFSAEAIDHIRMQLPKTGVPETTLELQERHADDFSGIARQNFDTVILNSVVQYFPSIDYLKTVLNGAVERVAPGGVIFIGDVRNLLLLEAFHTSVQIHKAAPGLAARELSKRIRGRIKGEKELVIDPRFFIEVAGTLPEVTAVEILLKRGRNVNELVKYRYDVILHVGGHAPETRTEKRLDWQRLQMTLPALGTMLQDEKPAALYLKSIPNARVLDDVRWAEIIKDPEKQDATIARLTGGMDVDRDAIGVDPEDLCSFCGEQGYGVTLSWADCAADGAFGAILHREGMPPQIQSTTAVMPSPPSPDWHRFANNPLQPRQSVDIVPILRDYLRSELPEYMVPTAFTVMDRLPLTANGKVDRLRLPEPNVATQKKLAHCAPRTELEKKIARIWSDLLQVEEIGLQDNFFDLGGHSLLIMQVHARLVEELGCELEVVDLFQYPVIESMARYLSAIDGEEEREEVPKPVRWARARAAQRRQADPAAQSIAIIAMAGRFPGAADIDTFWQNLRDGVESIRFFNEEELRQAGVPESLLADPNYVKARGVVDGIEFFDASFFGYAPREAELVDPQQRFFLETAWQALEKAGYDPDRTEGLIGVYGGVTRNTYQPATRIETGGIQGVINSDKDFLATRVAYKLNLRGPAITVQTACSTSLVAVHLACQALLSRECDLALAGGASIVLPLKAGYLYVEDSLLSPDGHCRTFDAKAKGTVGGSGVGIVVLKRLPDARRDNDTILAVIRGTAINNDGSDKVGFTAPSVGGQAEVIALAQAAADIEAATIGYVEAHGTGTTLGDPIEVKALREVFGRGRPAAEGAWCALGSLKTNIGHLDAAAGVAGLIKTVLQLKNRTLVPSLNFSEPNPQIDFTASPFYVNTKLQDWQSSPSTPRRAGVSSFGIGGTNAHVIIEEAPLQMKSGPSRTWQLLNLSARNPKTLQTMRERLIEELDQHPPNHLADIAYTLQVGRRQFDHRQSFPCRDTAELLRALQNNAPQRVFTATRGTHRPDIVFMFPGQGAQYPNMGIDLYRSEPEFKKVVDRCTALFSKKIGVDLRQAIYPGDGNREEAAARLQTPSIAQAALFSVELALARLWMSWGVEPSACIGHSIGEYVAACLAGVLGEEDVISLIAIRGILMDQAPAGSMLAVQLAPTELENYLVNGVSLAAVNGPCLSVVSGKTRKIAQLAEKLQQQGINCRILHTGGPFHSSLMAGVVEPLVEAAARYGVAEPAIPYISNLSGTWISHRELSDPGYWGRHACSQVRFADGIKELLKAKGSIFLEVGPGSTLCTLTRQNVPGGERQEIPVCTSLRHPRETTGDEELMARALAQLWVHGAEIDWLAYHKGEQRCRVELPTYPFERQRCWVENGDRELRPAAHNHSPKNHDVSQWFYLPCWKSSLLLEGSSDNTLARQPWLILTDNSGLGKNIVDQLRQRGGPVITVKNSVAYSRIDEQCYHLNAARPEDYAKLFEDLRHANLLPVTVVHLWGLQEGPQHDVGNDFYSLLYLTKILSSLGRARPIRIGVVTNGGQRVLDEEVNPYKAMLSGFCTVVSQEYPWLQCCSIDIAMGSNEKQMAQSAGSVINELMATTPEAMVAYRGAQRWLQTFDRLPLTPPAPTMLPLRRGGIYLITGGLGNVGYELSSYLASQYQAKLIIISRTEKKNRIRQLRTLGGEVLFIAADVADLVQMKQAFQESEKRFGPLNGVIHAAAVVAGRSMANIRDLDHASCEEQFRPKIKGTEILNRLLKGKKLDFAILMSSLASILGGMGFGAYSPANSFLDGFAHRSRSRSGVRWLSVNWDSWRLGGVEKMTKSPVAGLAMEPAQGLEAFTRLLTASPAAQIAVSTADLDSRLQQWLGGAGPLKEKVPTVETEGVATRTSLTKPRHEIDEKVAAIWTELLGVPDISIDDDFFELGGHSLLGTQLVNRLSEEFGVMVRLQDLFEAPLLAGLADLVMALMLEGADQEILAEVQQIKND